MRESVRFLALVETHNQLEGGLSVERNFQNIEPMVGRNIARSKLVTRYFDKDKFLSYSYTLFMNM